MKILFGVSSGISIYKTLSVIRKLVMDNHSVKVVMTPNATRFISPILFQTLCKNEVFVGDFDCANPLAHIELSDWADCLVVAPCTANTLSKIASGIADNLLTSTILACNKRRILFPAMNVKMFENPIIAQNIVKLRQNQILVVEPDEGDLACGYSGKGRLPDEETILGIIGRDVHEALKNQKYIVTAGGTREAIDPVRFIGNDSSGKMGVSIAKELYRKGAEVLLVYADVRVKIPDYLSKIHAPTTLEMLHVLQANLPYFDGLFMAAACADYRVETPSQTKIKKGESLELKLVKNPDILGELSSAFGHKLRVGFALESDTGDWERVLEKAREKLSKKGLDYIILNTINSAFSPLGSEENRVHLLARDGSVLSLEMDSKTRIAERIVEKILC